MATGSGDDNFDWVTAQAGCSAELMFEKLQDGARADAERRNGATFGRRDDWRFEFHADEGEGFEVVRIAGSSKESAIVTFRREGARIEITGDGVDVQISRSSASTPTAIAVTTFGEIEYLGWEVRKLALDMLFFEESED
jgi:hypothetical protein